MFLTEWAGFDLQPKYACAGGPGSNFKNSANFRKANNAPRNAKGSGGSGSQGPSVKEAGRKGTDGYKLGKYWDKLHSLGSKIPGMTPKKQNKMYGVLKEAKRKFGGEIKMDKSGTLYKFDTGHKNGKIHLERIEKKSDGFYGTGEVDPKTGEVLKPLKRFLGK